MTDYITDLNIGMFTDPTGCVRNHIILVLIRKEGSKHFDYMIIIFPKLRCNKTYHTRHYIRHDDNLWRIEPKDRIYQWVERLPLISGRSETLFIIDDIITDETLDAWRQCLLELANSDRYCKHYYGCLDSLILSYPRRKNQNYICSVF